MLSSKSAPMFYRRGRKQIWMGEITECTNCICVDPSCLINDFVYRLVWWGLRFVFKKVKWDMCSVEGAVLGVRYSTFEFRFDWKTYD